MHPSSQHVTGQGGTKTTRPDCWELYMRARACVCVYLSFNANTCQGLCNKVHTYRYRYMYIQYMYIHVYIYISIYLFIHICIYIYMCIYICVYIYVYVYMHTCIYVYMHVYIYFYLSFIILCIHHTYMHADHSCFSFLRLVCVVVTLNLTSEISDPQHFGKSHTRLSDSSTQDTYIRQSESGEWKDEAPTTFSA